MSSSRADSVAKLRALASVAKPVHLRTFLEADDEASAAAAAAGAGGAAPRP